MASKVKLEGGERRIHAKLRQHVWMQFAENSERHLRPELERAERPDGTRKAPRGNAEIALIDADGGERRNRIGLGGESIGFRRLA